MPDGNLTPFERAARVPANLSQATAVEQSRAVAEVQAAVVVAQNRPRDKTASLSEMREVCAMEGFAERAFFSFSRGGSAVKGETVHLARELARCWGNINSGLVELSRDDISGKSEMMAFAWDLQTNARQQTTFIVPHSRDTKAGKKAITDDRDVYENNANMGARRLREMIFAVLPVWFRDEAADRCRHTLQHGGGKPMAQRIADCVSVWASIGVSRDQLERHSGRKIDDLTPEDLASMHILYRSIKAGEITRDEAFPREAETSKPLPANADGFEKAAAGKKAKPQVVQQDEPPAYESSPIEDGDYFPGDVPLRGAK